MYNIHTFTYQKTLIPSLVFKIVEAFSASLNNT